MSLVLRCMAEGTEGSWEAICLDLDIAVSGGSLAEVTDSLHGAVAEYLEFVATLSEEDQIPLLNRKAPLWLRFQFAYRSFAVAVGWPWHNSDGGKSHVPIMVPA
ncbi:hypothetical protein QMT40_001765 [Parvibaculaceae bacterium PLY_AMNH_Bact1]|nr:hypothetical protein QMT40_001765 [Parvibaculaceae bacterium PLY_AMNH_Bact1]